MSVYEECAKRRRIASKQDAKEEAFFCGVENEIDDYEPENEEE
jgi:hypothetical protein